MVACAVALVASHVQRRLLYKKVDEQNRPDAAGSQNRCSCLAK